MSVRFVSRTLKSLLGVLSVSLFLGTSACEDDSASNDAGTGAITFTTWGEDYIEDKIPSDTFADGWSVSYSKFLITISEITVADDTGAVAAKMTGSKVFDMHKTGVKEIVNFANLPAKNWTKVSYRVAPATVKADLGPGVTEADRELLVNANASIYLDATATKGAVSKHYTWSFSTDTVYADCEAELDGKLTQGAVVTNGGTDSIQLTIHGDHFYYDDLQATNAKVRFEAIASADKDNDGEITLQELDNVSLVDIPASEGGFGVGSASDINTLGQFVTALSRTVGHYRGEGECFAEAK